MENDKDIIGMCPLCDMPLIKGSSVDKHHLIPKSKKGSGVDVCHVICHRKIHSTLSENELFGYWHTWERLRQHQELRKYIKWVRKQLKRNPEYISSHKDTRDRYRKRF